MRGSNRPHGGPVRRIAGALATLAVIAAIAAVVALLQPPPPTLAGRPTVVDADTLRFGAERVRLAGIDAVELEQTCSTDKGAAWNCGKDARDYVRALVGSRTLRCMPEGRDRYGRTVARCAGDDGDLGDLGDRIVRAGWAVADFGYAAALAEARAGRRGIWSGGFQDPAAWRRSHGDESFDVWGWLLGWFNR